MYMKTYTLECTQPALVSFLSMYTLNSNIVYLLVILRKDSKVTPNPFLVCNKQLHADFTPLISDSSNATFNLSLETLDHFWCEEWCFLFLWGGGGGGRWGTSMTDISLGLFYDGLC